MAIKMDTEADYVLEAYWWSHKVVDNVVKKHKKFVLACVTAYRDYESEEIESIQITVEGQAYRAVQVSP